jgi:hypothetical protein
MLILATPAQCPHHDFDEVVIINAQHRQRPNHVTAGLNRNAPARANT